VGVSCTWLLGGASEFRESIQGGIAAGARRDRDLDSYDVSIDGTRSGRPLQSGLFNGLTWSKVGCASIAHAAMAPIDFPSLPGCVVIPRETGNSLAAILR
jgi:hypothetical protein